MAFRDENLPVQVPAAVLAAADKDDLQELVSAGVIPATTRVSAQVTAGLLYISAVLPDEIENALTAALGSGVTDPQGLNQVMRNAVDKDLDLEDVIGMLIAGGAPANTDFHGTKLLRLKEGIERFLITDINNAAGSAQAQSRIMVSADMFAVRVEHYNHVPGGANCLFMDGHVEFIKYPTAPVNSGMAAIIGAAA